MGSKLIHFVSITDSFIMLIQNCWNLYLACKQQQVYGPVNYQCFRETEPRAALEPGTAVLRDRRVERSTTLPPGKESCKSDYYLRNSENYCHYVYE